MQLPFTIPSLTLIPPPFNLASKPSSRSPSPNSTYSTRSTASTRGARSIHSISPPQRQRQRRTSTSSIILSQDLPFEEETDGRVMGILEPRPEVPVARLGIGEVLEKRAE
ncbi:hypothetical protein ACLMJK_004070 [Lecanora helva]